MVRMTWSDLDVPSLARQLDPAALGHRAILRDSEVVRRRMEFMPEDRPT
jgi:hypothetical protein